MTGLPAADLPGAEVEALQSALAAEHAAVYAYGVIGAALDGQEEQLARTAVTAHRARRDRLAVTVRDAGDRPVAAQPAYDLPVPVVDAGSARALAVTVEERLAAVWADVVAGTTGVRREGAALALQDVAVRGAAWRGRTVAFPGLPERTVG